MRVIASADEGPLVYVWYEMTRMEEDGSEYWIEGDAVPGADGDSLTVTVEAQAAYKCIVSDPWDEREVMFIVAVDNGLTAAAAGTDKDYVELRAAEGSEVKLAVDAHANEGGLTYCWYHNQMTEEDGCYEYVPVEGADGAEMTTAPIREMVEYYCGVTDIYGNVREVHFLIYVEDGFTLVPKGDYEMRPERLDECDPTETEVWYVQAAPGDTVTLAYEAESRNGLAAADWASDRWDWERRDCAPNEPLVLENVTDGGLYLAEVRNSFGEEKSLCFRVVLTGEPVFDPLDKDRDGDVDVLDAAAFLAALEPDGAVLVLRRVVGLD